MSSQNADKNVHQPVFKGKVVKKVLDKTITVAIVRQFRHPIYEKTVTRTKKYLVHDPKNSARENDYVSIIRIRPVSARKCFRLYKIITSATVVASPTSQTPLNK